MEQVLHCARFSSILRTPSLKMEDSDVPVSDLHLERNANDSLLAFHEEPAGKPPKDRVVKVSQFFIGDDEALPPPNVHLGLIRPAASEDWCFYPDRLSPLLAFLPRGHTQGHYAQQPGHGMLLPEIEDKKYPITRYSEKQRPRTKRSRSGRGCWRIAPSVKVSEQQTTTYIIY